ncbi:MAG: hypothetical protein ACXV9Q_04135 [Chthoniobacterales bacterium]
MRTSACSYAFIFFAAARLAFSQEARIPEQPPPPELVGRWLEKTPRQSGDLVGYNVYCFGRQSEFLVLSMVRNDKTQKWEPTKRLYRKEHRAISGYLEATSPNTLVFQVVVYAMAVLPIEARYKVTGDTLALSKDLFDPTIDRVINCERIRRLPGETEEEAAAFQKRLEDGLNGRDFRRVFESAAHEMKPHPSDDELIAGFIEHRDELETLRKMMQTDKELKRVDVDWTQPDDPASVGVSSERIEVYRELCRRVGLERGVEAFGDSAKRVAFLASTRGLSISGSSKSYVWLSSPPETDLEHPLVANLDAYANYKRNQRREYFAKHQRAMSGNVDALRHLEGNWYLEYEEN